MRKHDMNFSCVTRIGLGLLLAFALSFMLVPVAAISAFADEPEESTSSVNAYWYKQGVYASVWGTDAQFNENSMSMMSAYIRDTVQVADNASDGMRGVWIAFANSDLYTINSVSCDGNAGVETTSGTWRIEVPESAMTNPVQVNFDLGVPGTGSLKASADMVMWTEESAAVEKLAARLPELAACSDASSVNTAQAAYDALDTAGKRVFPAVALDKITNANAQVQAAIDRRTAVIDVKWARINGVGEEEPSEQAARLFGNTNTVRVAHEINGTYTVYIVAPEMPDSVFFEVSYDGEIVAPFLAEAHVGDSHSYTYAISVADPSVIALFQRHLVGPMGYMNNDLRVRMDITGIEFPDVMEADAYEEKARASAAEVAAMIDALTDQSTAAEVKSAADAYNALSDDAKMLVDDAAKAKLEAAKKRISARSNGLVADADRSSVKDPKPIKAFTVNVKTVTAKAVAAAARKAGASATSTTSITLGKKVKTIKKGAFKSFKKVKTVIVKSKKLSKKSVKGSLKGSKVKTVKVAVGSKSANKKYVKKYRKVFTKANAGKKAKVRY